MTQNASAMTLNQLNLLVKQALKNAFSMPVWIVAELADVKENRSGHCYLELVEKREADEAVVASARATVWSFTYRTLKPYFETTTGKSLQKGMKVLLRVEVTFHELYGYSLNVKDIDPTFTMGDLERKKREILERLTREGVINMNRELEFPLLPKNIAVISSPTAAGYGDFMDQLHHNPYGYHFHTALFPALMQGEKSAESIIGALERIYAYEELFDAVVIIRGGGSQTDLGCFDSYELAVNVAQFPLPIIAGIGHERDETIVDRVAHQSLKTPTAVAAFFVEAFSENDNFLADMRDRFVYGVTRKMEEEKKRQLLFLTSLQQQLMTVLEKQRHRLELIVGRSDQYVNRFIQQQQYLLEQKKMRTTDLITVSLERQYLLLEERRRQLTVLSQQLITRQKHLLEVGMTTVRFADPGKILERGFSITRYDGKMVRDVNQLPAGVRIETEVASGRIVSCVESTEKTT